MQIVGFGASSMAGAGDSQGGFFRRLPELLTRHRSGLEFVNLGIGGNTTRDMLARAEAVSRLGKHDTVVLLGCNDVPRANDRSPQIRTTLDEYERNVRTLLPLIRGEFSLFVSSFTVCADRTGVAEETLAAYMRSALVAADDAGYAVWDLFGELRGADLTRYWAADGLHFNDAGHEMLAARLAEHLRPRYAG